MEKKSIVIVQYSANLDGSAFSALLLADGYRAAGWETHIVFGFEGPIISLFKSHRHSCYIEPHRNWLRSGKVLSFFKHIVLELQRIRKFRILFRQIDPSLIYVNTLVSLPCVVVGRILKISVIWHLREMLANVNGELRIPTILKAPVQFFISYLPNQFVANSRAVANNILGDRQRRLEIVPNAVSPDFFGINITKKQARTRLNLPNVDLLIGFPGNLRPVKGHVFFLRAIAELLHSNKSWQVAITGSGSADYVEEIEALITKNGLGSQIRLLGPCNSMSDFYRACDLVCVTSQSETFGRTIIEAFASKVPVIATAVGGIPEIIRDKENGYLINYGDEEGLRTKITDVIEHLEQQSSIVERAYEDAKSLYTAEVYQQRIINISERLI